MTVEWSYLHLLETHASSGLLLRLLGQPCLAICHDLPGAMIGSSEFMCSD
jgi:hypothetical protein